MWTACHRLSPNSSSSSRSFQLDLVSANRWSAAAIIFPWQVKFFFFFFFLCGKRKKYVFKEWIENQIKMNFFSLLIVAAVTVAVAVVMFCSLTVCNKQRTRFVVLFFDSTNYTTTREIVTLTHSLCKAHINFLSIYRKLL